ncbi:MAG TPA: response regulator [Firmicutes bacterium]|nr:response regulator [Bacillota bacterium]
MTQLRVVVADDEPIIRMDLRELLEEEGCSVVGEAGDGVTLVSLARALKPDLALVDIKMPQMDGLEAARILVEEDICAVLLLTAYSQKELVNKAAEVGIHGYLVKPIKDSDIMPAISIAMARFQELRGLKKKTEELSAKLEVRKVLEKAKGILMKKYTISEEEAHRRILKASMDSRKSIKDIADAIILNNSFFEEVKPA